MPNVLELPIGVQVGPGRIERLIEVKKFSGKIQRDAASAEAKKNAAVVTDNSLPDVIVKVGDLKPNSMTARQMTIPDRDYLMAKVRRLTFGPIVKQRYECQECLRQREPNSLMEHRFNIDEIPVTVLSDEDTRWWDGEKVFKLEGDDPEVLKRAKIRAFEIVSRDEAVTAVFRYPTGIDQRKVAFTDKIKENPAQVVQELMALGLLQINATKAPRDGFDYTVWDTIDAGQLTDIQTSWEKQMPGIEMQQEVECAKGHRREVVLQTNDFLSPEK